MDLRYNKKTLTYGLNERDGYKESEQENKQLIDICKAIDLRSFAQMIVPRTTLIHTYKMKECMRKRTKRVCDDIVIS